MTKFGDRYLDIEQVVAAYYAKSEEATVRDQLFLTFAGGGKVRLLENELGFEDVLEALELRVLREQD